MPELLPILAPILGIGAADATTLAGLTVVAPALAGAGAAGLGGLGTALGLGAAGLGAAGAAGAFGGGGAAAGAGAGADGSGAGIATREPGIPIIGDNTVDPLTVTANAGGGSDLGSTIGAGLGGAAGAGASGLAPPAGGTVDPLTVTANPANLSGGSGVGSLAGGGGADVLTQLLGQTSPQQPFANQSNPGGTTQSGGYQIQNTAQGADGNTYTYDPTTGGYVDQNGLPMGTVENQQIDQAAQAAAQGGSSTDSVGTTVSGLNVSVPASTGASPLTSALLGTDAFGSTLSQLNNGGFQVTAHGTPTTSPLDVVAPGAATGLAGLDVVAHPLQPNVSALTGLSPFLAPFLIPPGSPDAVTNGGSGNNFPNLPNGGAQQPGAGGSTTPKPAGTPFGGSGAGVGSTGGLPTGVSGSTKPKIFPWVTPDQGGSDVGQSA